MLRSEGLLEDHSNLRAKLDATVATVMDIDPKFVAVRPKNRKRFHEKRMDEIPETSSEQLLSYSRRRV